MELLQYDSVCEKLLHKRQKLGLNQNTVARKAEVDKATVSRVENKKVKNVNYQTVYDIWEALDGVEKEQSSMELAKDIMSDQITWVTADDSARDARKLMYECCFSQLPIKSPDRKECIGVVTERILMRTDDITVKLSEIMGPTLIEIKPKTSKETIINLFKDDEPAVLVKNNEGSYVGIVTPADTF